ncbi:MAG: hypothetical protein GF418_06760 [Chitinivibrionales bacterium]|nr:hypothetical protein [Chitinivibrionales bacterium]MBD3395312.1 hypothetical protein [Chitinivibrionales bacterium]
MDSFVVLGLDAWDGTGKQVREFIRRTGVTLPVLRDASTYIDRLQTIDNRGSYFLLNEDGVVMASCDDGYRSLDCFDPQRLDSTITAFLAPGGNDK